jgi:AraC-like DNA-binding protein
MNRIMVGDPAAPPARMPGTDRGEALRRWLAWFGRTRPDIIVVEAAYRRCATDWRVGPRTMDVHVILVLDQGSCAGRVGEQEIAIQAGEGVWITPGVPHRLDVLPGPQMVMHHMRWRSNPARPMPVPPARVLRQAGACRSTLAALVNEAAHGGQLQQERLRALLAVLAVDAERAATVGQEAANALSPARCELVRRLVREHPDHRFTSRELAHACGLSEAHFRRSFGRSFGCPPRVWQAQARLRAAAVRLASSADSIGRIASEHGWSDIHLFCRQFKQLFQATPGAWRASRGG